MQCESKLSMTEVVGGLDGVVEPLKEESKGKETSVKLVHDLRI